MRVLINTIIFHACECQVISGSNSNLIVTSIAILVHVPSYHMHVFCCQMPSVHFSHIVSLILNITFIFTLNVTVMNLLP